VDISIPGSTAQGGRLARVLEIEEDEASTAGIRPRRSTNGDTVLLFFVDNHIVSAADGKAVPEPRQIRLGVERHRLLWVNSEELDMLVRFQLEGKTSHRSPCSYQKSGHHG
jgi:hypothetical protein